MTENKNNSLVWILIILIILLVAFFGFYFYKNSSLIRVKEDQNKSQKENSREVNHNLDRRRAVDLNQLVDNIKNDYKESQSFKECIGMDMGIQSCLRQEIDKKIRESDNPRFCDDLNNDGDRNDCKENYYIEKAEKTMDPAVCDNISINKESCLRKVYVAKAKKAEDETICDSLKEDYSKQSCKRDVIREKAIKTNNSALCDKLVIVRKEGEGENATEVKDDMDVQMCKEEVKMEKERKEMEEKMRKEREERKEIKK